MIRSVLQYRTVKSDAFNQGKRRAYSYTLLPAAAMMIRMYTKGMIDHIEYFELSKVLKLRRTANAAWCANLGPSANPERRDSRYA